MRSYGTNDSAPGGPAVQTTLLVGLAQACLADAISRHPRLALAPESFAAYLHERMPDMQELPTHGDDLVIACACLHEDTGALELFDKRVRGVVDEVIPRMRYHSISADELHQLLRVKLLCREAERAPRIAGYKGSGPLRAWVRVAAVRTILNQRRADQVGASSAGELADLAEAAAQPDPRTQLLLQQHRNAFRASVGEALQSLTPMQQRLLRQHHLRGLTLPDLASIYSLHRVTVAKKLRGAREQVMRATRAGLAKSYGLTNTDIDSLLHHLGARGELALELSLASTVASLAISG